MSDHTATRFSAVHLRHEMGRGALELLCYRTAAIVMKRYVQPGREDFRRTLAGKTPAAWGR